MGGAFSTVPPTVQVPSFVYELPYEQYIWSGKLPLTEDCASRDAVLSEREIPPPCP